MATAAVTAFAFGSTNNAQGIYIFAVMFGPSTQQKLAVLCSKKFQTQLTQTHDISYFADPVVDFKPSQADSSFHTSSTKQSLRLYTNVSKDH